MPKAVVTVVLFAEVSGRATGGMSCNVHIKAKVLRTLARCAHRSPVGLADMNGMVAVLMQDVNKRSAYKYMVDSFPLAFRRGG